MNDRHGRVTIFIGKQTVQADLNRIQGTIANLITWGLVLQVEKTKAGRTDGLNGKNAVTVGPYRRATDSKTKRYAMYVGNDKTEYLDAWTAAREFIDWVGYNLARQAVRDYASKH